MSPSGIMAWIKGAMSMPLLTENRYFCQHRFYKAQILVNGMDIILRNPDMCIPKGKMAEFSGDVKSNYVTATTNN
jgi:hypothetical protein